LVGFGCSEGSIGGLVGVDEREISLGFGLPREANMVVPLHKRRRRLRPIDNRRERFE
jgi:hypothetical protein